MHMTPFKPLALTALLLALTGCPSNADPCVGDACEPKTCSPACSGSTPVCDSATLTCKTCTATEGCAKGKLCDTSTSKGRCVACIAATDCPRTAPYCEPTSKTCTTCTETEGCGPYEICDFTEPEGACLSTGCSSNAQCSGTTPICDTSTRKCKLCTATQGCPAGKQCDLTVAGGSCVPIGGCTASAQCSNPTPVCNTATAKCVVCTAAEGCSTGYTCNTAVAGGVCTPVTTTCTSNAQCSGGTPICNTSTGQCVVCTTTQGCLAGYTCNTATATGQCVPVTTTCTSSAQCSGGTPVCNTASGQCVVCTASQGCSSGYTCITTIPGGQCVPVTATCTSRTQCPSSLPVCNTATGQCVVCTETEGCFGSYLCDLAIPGGRCVPVTATCTSNAQCSGATPVCNTSTGQCVVCTTTQGCSSGYTCNTTTPGGQCVPSGCSANAQCSGATPVCNTSTGQCVVCTTTQGCSTGFTCDTTTALGHCVAGGCTSNAQCSSPTPVCNTASGQCVVCTTTQGCSAGYTCNTTPPSGQCVPNGGCTSNAQCSGATPVCNTTLGQCVVCTTTQGCAVGSTCNTTVPGGQCVIGTTSAQIAAVYAAPVGAMSLPVLNALVTYVKPATGSDGAGFFVQGEQTGPALFVEEGDLTPTPAPGDRVSFTVTATSDRSTLRVASDTTGYVRHSANNPIAPLLQDVSSQPDLVSSIANYQAEYVKATGTITGPFAPSGMGHLGATISTAGFTGTGLVLRVPPSLRTSWGLDVGCTFTLRSGVMWRYNVTSQLSSYDYDDLLPGSVSCPFFAVKSATSSGSSSVDVVFNRELDPTSFYATGSQFSISGGLAVTSAVIRSDNRTISLATSQQMPMTYTVSVASSLRDFSGASLVSNTATFQGAVQAPKGLLISQVYPFGGSMGPLYKSDYVELHNSGATSLNLTGWSLQNSSATSATWYVTPLTGTIPPGGYYLVKGASGTEGTELPVLADVTNTSMNLSGTNGSKLALVPSTTALVGTCPTGTVDLVGYGTAGCSEGLSPAAMPPDYAQAILRTGGGCIDTDSNAADFTSGPANPRNSASMGLTCSP